MYYGKEKQHGKVFSSSISVFLSITYKNENKNTTCFREKWLQLKKRKSNMYE